MAVLPPPDHLSGQEVHALTECDLLVVERVDVLEELLDQLDRHDLEPFHERAELRLVNDSVVVEVDGAELLGEAGEELLVLTQLEV